MSPPTIAIKNNWKFRDEVPDATFYRASKLFSMADFRQRMASNVSLHIRVRLSLKTHPATEKVRSLVAALAGMGRTLRATRYKRGKRFWMPSSFQNSRIFLWSGRSDAFKYLQQNDFKQLCSLLWIWGIEQNHLYFCTSPYFSTSEVILKNLFDGHISSILWW